MIARRETFVVSVELVNVGRLEALGRGTVCTFRCCPSPKFILFPGSLLGSCGKQPILKRLQVGILRACGSQRSCEPLGWVLAVSEEGVCVCVCT